MKRIGIVNNPLFPVDEWSRQTINFDVLFIEPDEISQVEIELARRIMNIFQLEIDNDEGLIEFITRPQEFMYFLINLERTIAKLK